MVDDIVDAGAQLEHHIATLNKRCGVENEDGVEDKGSAADGVDYADGAVGDENADYAEHDDADAEGMNWLPPPS